MQVSAWLLFAYILFNICTLTSTDYYIKNDRQLTYLYHKFNKIEEEIFPADIRIQFSVSRIVGTLLYSIDRNMNQLILNFHDSTPPTLTVEYNTQKTFISISKLCSCEWCRYETLDLRLLISNREVHLRCNGGDDHSFVLGKTRKLDKNYPIIYNATNDSTTSMNEAHIWLVNTPPIGGSTPNHYQTHGCIFEVTYRRRSISFEDVTPNIKRSCKRTCIDNICNGGHCLETYNDYPVCNCTSTFLNGRYCNDSMASMNLKTLSSLYVFDMIKISWRSTLNEIMQLHNTNLNIDLVYKENHLIVEYSYQNGIKFSFKATIFENYVPNKESICIFYFNKNYIDIWTFNKEYWNKITILSYSNLRQDVFNAITLQSGDGVIDFRYKYAHEYEWRNISIVDYEPMVYDRRPVVSTKTEIYSSKSRMTSAKKRIYTGHTQTTPTIDQGFSKTTVIAVIAILSSALLITMIGLFAIVIIKLKKSIGVCTIIGQI